jgi:uncharacterized protein
VPTDRMQRNIERHHSRLRGAIAKQLPQIIGGEDVITAPDGKRLRVPVRYLDEPRFMPARESTQDKQGQGLGQGQPGQQHRDPEIEVELTIEELSELLFEDLRLPRLKPKASSDEMSGTQIEGITTRGPSGRLHLKRSVIEYLKHGGEWRDEDLRYKDIRTRTKPITKAVVVFVRDASASMDELKRYRVRAAAFWALRWLSQQYQNCQPVFILHDTAAEEVDESTFLKATVMGGTMLSSGVSLASNILSERYPNDIYNRYVLHFSDGENWFSDDNRFVEAVKQLHESVQMYAFCQVSPVHFGRPAGVSALISNLGPKFPRIVVGHIWRNEEVATWLSQTFGGVAE